MRGYAIDFGSLEGRESWVANCPFVSQFHVLGPAVPAAVEEEQYLAMSAWSSSNWENMFATRRFLESSWPHAYKSLSRLAKDPETRPDFILADYWVDAARDVSAENGIPLAMHWPQMPTAMLHAPYIPGTPGLQIEVLSSEHATMWQRYRNAISIYTSAWQYRKYLQWRKAMREQAGVLRPLPTLRKPDYLCFVNSMFGLEVAKDLPPNVAAVGPILADSVESLTQPYAAFLSKRRRVLYVSLGTHVLLPWARIEKMLLGVLAALASGVIDGVIWPMRPMARKQLDGQATLPVASSQSQFPMTVSQLLAGAHPSILVPEFAPQRALLQDDRVAIFLSHGGPASANEAVYAGKPLITIAVYFDQIQNAMRLRDAGVSVPLDKNKFSSADVASAIADIMRDKQAEGPMVVNVERMQRLASITARRKHLAVDMIEEVLVDFEGRERDRQVRMEARVCGRPRHMHLQTADVRMPALRAKNWDMWILFFLGLFFSVGTLSLVFFLN